MGVRLADRVNDQYCGHDVDDYVAGSGCWLLQRDRAGWRRTDRVLALSIPDWSADPVRARFRAAILRKSLPSPTRTTKPRLRSAPRSASLRRHHRHQPRRWRRSGDAHRRRLHPFGRDVCALPAALTLAGRAKRCVGRIRRTIRNTIADAFVEPHCRGAATHYYYVRGKARGGDPLQSRSVVAALRKRQRPRRCLRPRLRRRPARHALRADGPCDGVFSVDFDPRKIGAVANAAGTLTLRDWLRRRVPRPRRPAGARPRAPRLGLRCSGDDCNTCRTGLRNACSATPSPCSFPGSKLGGTRRPARCERAQPRRAALHRVRRCHRLDAAARQLRYPTRDWFERRLAGAGAPICPLHRAHAVQQLADHWRRR